MLCYVRKEAMKYMISSINDKNECIESEWIIIEQEKN